MQHYHNTVQDPSGIGIDSAQVTVKDYPAGTTATIYSDDGITGKDNPFFTNSIGMFDFYAADGRYTIEISKSGYTTQIITDVLLEDPSDASPVVATSLTVNGNTILGDESTDTITLNADTVSIPNGLTISGTSPTAQVKITDGTVTGRLEADTNKFEVGSESAHAFVLFSNNSEVARLTDDGNFLIGSTTNDAGSKFQVTGDVQFVDDGTSLNVSLINYNEVGAYSNGSMVGRRARGTRASPTAVLSGDRIFNFSASGYGATGFASASGRIEFLAAENFTDSANGTHIEFLTTPLGASAPLQRARLTSEGAFLVGTLTSLDSSFTSTPKAQVGVVSASSLTQLQAFSATGTHEPVLSFLHSKTASLGAITTANANTDALGRIIFEGVGTTTGSLREAVSIRASVNGAPGTTFVPGALSVYTTNTSGVNAVRLLLSSSGKFDVYGTAASAVTPQGNGLVVHDSAEIGGPVGIGTPHSTIGRKVWVYTSGNSGGLLGVFGEARDDSGGSLGVTGVYGKAYTQVASPSTYSQDVLGVVGEVDATSNGTVTAASGVLGLVSNTNAAATITTGSSFRTKTNLVAGTITNYNGLKVVDVTSGATNIYGVKSEVTSGATKWNIYADGTAKNHFAGTVLIGTTSDNGLDALQVNGTIKSNNVAKYLEVRTLPTTVNDCVDIGSFAPVANGTFSMSVAVSLSNSGMSASKFYVITGAFPLNYTTATWYRVPFVRSSGVYAGNDFDLEVYVNGTTSLTLRLRRSAGATASTSNNTRILITEYSNLTFTASSTVTAGAATVNEWPFVQQMSASRISIGNSSSGADTGEALQVVGTSKLNGTSSSFAGTTGQWSIDANRFGSSALRWTIPSATTGSIITLLPGASATTGGAYIRFYNQTTDTSTGAVNFGFTGAPGTTQFNIQATSFGGGTAPVSLAITALRVLVGTTTDNGSNQLQIAGSVSANSTGARQVNLTTAGAVYITSDSSGAFTEGMFFRNNANSATLAGVGLYGAAPDTATYMWFAADSNAHSSSQNMRLWASGTLAIGASGTEYNWAGVTSASTYLVGGTQVGFYGVPEGNASATSVIASFFAKPRTVAAAFTSSVVASFYATDATKGAGSTITSLCGVFVPDQTQGNNNFGYYSSVGAGSAKWNFYAAGAAKNYFLGRVLIGATTDDNSSAVRISSASSDAMSGVNQYGLYSTPTFQSDCTNFGAAVTALPRSAAASFTMGIMAGVYVPDAVKGSGSTITSYAGAFVANLTAGTTNYAYYTNISSGAGKWAYFGAGTASSSLAGNLLVGTTTDTGGRLYVFGNTSLFEYNANGTQAITIKNNDAGNAATARLILDNGTIQSGLGIRGTAHATDPNSLFLYSNGANPISFYTNSTERMRLSAGGNFIVGTTTDDGSNKVQITGNLKATGRLFATMADGTGYPLAAAGTTKGLRVSHSSTASVVEGVDSTLTGSYQPLVVGGSDLRITTSGTERFRFHTDGSLHVKNSNGGTHVLATSGISFEKTAAAGESNLPYIRQQSLLTAAGNDLVLAATSTSGGVVFKTLDLTRGFFNGAGSFVLGNAAIATTATDGFLYVVTCAGAPTGVPNAYTGRVAVVFDTTNDRLYVYNGSWKSVAVA